MLFCVFVFFMAIKYRKYPYILLAVLGFAWFALSDMRDSVEPLIKAQLAGTLDKLVLLILTVLLWFFALRSRTDKNLLASAIVCSAGSVVRLVRTFVIDLVPEMMLRNGADILAITKGFSLTVSVIDSVIYILVIVSFALLYLSMLRNHDSV